MNLTLICLTVTSILLQINAQILFARKTPDYSFKSKTISELAERNAPQGPAVRVFFFLPQALLLWGLAYGLYTQNPLLETVSILVLLTGTGYFVATFFPCDKGSPIWGTISNRIHNLGGTFEYIGAVGGFLWFSYLELAPYSRVQHTLSMLLGIIILLAFFGMATQSLRPIRGIIQRIAEGCIFIWFLAMSFY